MKLTLCRYEGENVWEYFLDFNQNIPENSPHKFSLKFNETVSEKFLPQKSVKIISQILERVPLMIPESHHPNGGVIYSISVKEDSEEIQVRWHPGEFQELSELDELAHTLFVFGSFFG